MPLIDKETLKSFLGDKSFITNIDGVTGFETARKQSEDVVYQKTQIPIPLSINEAIPTLQFCAHAITIYIMSMHQPLKDEAEIKRRDTLYHNAMDILEKIQSGKFPLYDINGTRISSGNNSSATFYCSTQEEREERL